LILDKFGPEVEEDEVPEVDEVGEPESKLGEVYQLGNHRLMCGDSTDAAAVSELMDGTKADMVFTDPPYNIAYEGGSKKREMIKNDIVADFYQFLYDAYTCMFMATKGGASFYVCHADSERINFTKAFIDAGGYLSAVIIWAKNNATFGRQDYFWKHEPILYGWNEQGSHKWYGDFKQDTIWNIDRPSSSEEHPTMKPLALITKAIKNSSKQDDIVLDLFGGSGSTLIACEQTNRTCYMMELDPKYCDVIRKRYAQYVGEDDWIGVTPLEKELEHASR
jgi:DNA modification methylase